MKDYVNIYSDSQIVNALKRNEQTGKETGVKKALGMMGSGDHGGGPNSGQYARVLQQDGSTLCRAQMSRWQPSQSISTASARRKT